MNRVPNFVSNLFLSIFLINFFMPLDCVHIEGIWSPNYNLKVLARFGFHQTDQHHKHETSGYLYGNASLINQNVLNRNNSQIIDPYYNTGVLLFVNQTLFKEIFKIYNTKNLVENYQNSFCRKIYQVIIDVEEKCHESSSWKQHGVRYVPCRNIKDQACMNQSKYSEISGFKNYQITYKVDNQKAASFWYLLLVPCQRKTESFSNKTLTNKTIHYNTCSWMSSSNLKASLIYDFWIVNGHPNETSTKLIDFDHQFSFEQQNIWIYIILNLSYFSLLMVQIYICSKQKLKNFYYLFLISLLLRFLSYFFICLHEFVFCNNGKGFETLFEISEILQIISTGFLMFFLMVISKGWPFIKPEVFTKTKLIILALSYTVIALFLYIWMKKSFDAIENVDEFQTLPGSLNLLVRIFFMLWFINELRQTMMFEQDSKKQKFFKHFGAGILVWFVSLPIVVIIALQIDLMWRFKIINGFSSMSDLMVYIIATRMLWKTNSRIFLLGDNDLDLIQDDYNFYDDDISIGGTSETYKFSKASHRSSKHFYDNHISCDKNFKT